MRAQKILTDHSEQLTAVAEALLKLDTLSRTEFEAVMRGETLPDAPQPKPVVAEPEPEREIPTPAYQRASHALGDQEAFIEP